jgi:hypothetical protein
MMTIEERNRRMGYGTSPGHDYKQPIESYVGRHRAALVARGNTERLEQARDLSAKIEAVATKKKMTADDARVFLSNAHEYEVWPRGEKAVNDSWPATHEALVKKFGGEEGARSAIERAKAFMKEVATEVPHLAQTLDQTGFASDLRTLEIGAKYGVAEVKKD